MHNLTLRFTGPSAVDGFQRDLVETLDLTISGTQRLAVTTASSFALGLGNPDDEPVRMRNARLRYAAQQLGNELTQSVLRELRHMGHNV